MYQILPLQGSITVYGATLEPTAAPIHHPVFAPASHPLPFIKAKSPALNITQTSPILARLSLPSTFLLPSDNKVTAAVFLVLEHHSGLEGLRGGAVPGFAHIWGQERGDWGLRGIRFVSRRLLLLCLSAEMLRQAAKRLQRHFWPVRRLGRLLYTILYHPQKPCLQEI